jgi:hypothetical protein
LNGVEEYDCFTMKMIMGWPVIQEFDKRDKVNSSPSPPFREYFFNKFKFHPWKRGAIVYRETRPQVLP